MQSPIICYFFSEVSQTQLVSQSFNVVKFIVFFGRTLISRLALVESVDLLILNEVKKDLQFILLTYKTAFYGPLLAKDLLRPILQHVIRDLAQVIETVE